MTKPASSFRRLQPHRIGLRFPSGEARYYAIDADGSVYWLRPNKGSSKLQRWRCDMELSDHIRSAAIEHGLMERVPQAPAPIQDSSSSIS